MQVNELVERAHLNARLKGFWDGQSTNVDGHQVLSQELVLRTVPEKLCLIHSEVSEALEDYRAKSMVTYLAGRFDISSGKPCGFASEIADIVIRVADLCGALGINLEDELRLKMEYNASRPHMHGKIC